MTRRILITGASVAGNTAAWWLGRAGFDVTVVERSPGFRDGGRNIDVRGPGREVLRRMGLERTSLDNGTGEEGTAWVDADGRVKARFLTVEGGGDGPTAEMEILSGDLARLLYDPASEHATDRFGDSVVVIDQDGEGIPRIAPGLMNPHSRTGIRILHAVLAAASRPAVRKISGRLFGGHSKDPDLSRYEGPAAPPAAGPAVTPSSGSLSPLLALGAVGLVLGASAVIGRRNAPDSSHPAIRRWYRRLDKPSFTPPDAAFGAVWPVLEAGLAVGGYRLLRRPSGPARNAAVGLWLVNTAMVGGWTELFFREKRLGASTAASGAMVATSAAYVATAAKVDRPAAAAAVPFVAWIGFATLLAERIWRDNPEEGR